MIKKSKPKTTFYLYAVCETLTEKYAMDSSKSAYANAQKYIETLGCELEQYKGLYAEAKAFDAIRSADSTMNILSGTFTALNVLVVLTNEIFKDQHTLLLIYAIITLSYVIFFWATLLRKYCVPRSATYWAKYLVPILEEKIQMMSDKNTTTKPNEKNMEFLQQIQCRVWKCCTTMGIPDNDLSQIRININPKTQIVSFGLDGKCLGSITLFD